MWVSLIYAEENERRKPLIRTKEKQHRFHFPMPAHALIQLGNIVIGHPGFLSSPTHRLPIRRLSVD
jgi:hypothetical protein